MGATGWMADDLFIAFSLVIIIFFFLLNYPVQRWIQVFVRTCEYGGMQTATSDHEGFGLASCVGVAAGYWLHKVSNYAATNCNSASSAA